MSEQKIIDIKINYNDAITAVVATKTQINELTRANNLLGKDYAKNSVTIEENKVKVKDLTAQYNANSKQLQLSMNDVKGTEGAYQKLNLQYQVSAAKAKDLAATYGVNSMASKSAAAEALNLNDKLKAIDKTVGQNQRSVADYGLATAKLPGIFGEMQTSALAAYESIGQKLTGIKSLITDYSAALEAQKIAQAEAAIAAEIASKAEMELALAEAAGTATAEQAATAEALRATATASATVATEAGTTAMKLFKIALASTGIGLLVVALGALVTYFTSTNEGAKQFQRVMSGVNAVIEQGLKFMGSLGKLIVDVLTGNTKELANDWEMVKDNVGNATENIKKNYELGNKYAKDRQMIEERDRTWMIERTKLQGEYDQILLSIRNKKLSPAQAKAAAEQARAIGESIFQNDLKIAKNKETLIMNEQSLNSKKDKQAIADSHNKVQEIIAAHNRQSQTIENRQAVVEIRGQKASDKAISREIATTEKILTEKGKIIDAEDKNSLISEEIYNKRIKEIQDLSVEEYANLDKRAKFEKMTDDNLEIARETIKQKQIKRLQDIATARTNLLIQNLQTELKIIDLHNQELRSGREVAFEEQVSDLDRNLNASLEQNRIKLESDKSYVDQSKLIYQQYATDSASIEAQKEKRKLQNKSEQYSNELDLVQGNIDAESAIKKKQLDAQMKEELKNTTLTEQQRTIIKSKYAKSQKQIDQDAFMAKLDMAAQVTSGLAELLGKDTEAGKLAAAATVGIQGAQYAFKTGAQAASYFASGNIPMGVLAGVETGIIIANTAKSIADIYAVKTDIASDSKASTSTTTQVTSSYHTGGIAGQDADSSLKSNEITATLLKGEKILNIQQKGIFDKILNNISSLGGPATVTSGVGMGNVNQVDAMEIAFDRSLAKMKNPVISWNDFALQAQRQQQLEKNKLVK